MRRIMLTMFVTGVVLQSTALGDSAPSGKSSAARKGPEMETLLRATLESVDSTDVIVSRVTIPPNTSLPKHWHPGEEFAYILAGSLTLWQEGKDDIVGKPGDAVKVAWKQVHTAITNDEGATILVFRVHEQGKPERVPVESD